RRSRSFLACSAPRPEWPERASSEAVHRRSSMAKTDLVVRLGDQLYAVERPWGELPSGIRIRGLSDVAVDSRDRVYAFQRSDPPVVVFDRSGAYLDSWGSGVIADAHGIYCTPDNRIIVADRD